MAVPALKLDGAAALLGAWPEPAGEATWARSARLRAADWFAARGAPVRRDEYFRYTDPASLTAPVPVEVPVRAGTGVSPFASAERVRLVFVDGIFAPEKSDAVAVEGLEILPLSEVLAKDIHWARDLFGVLEGEGQSPVERPLAALNTARATEGLVIHATGLVSAAVSLVYERGAAGADALVHHVIRLDAGADLTLLEEGAGAARFNSVAEVEVADGASFHHVRVQGRDHDRRAATALFARLGAESRLKSFTLTMNGRLTRNEAVVTLGGSGGVAHIAGACIGGGAFVHDDTIFVTHAAQGCESRQVFKKVLRDGATGVFQGKILVKPIAQQTDGYQISQGLLLDETSQFLAKPELEIYADDVKCSHGSTAGAVDATALFYLTSRGVPRKTAEELLVLAFVDDAIAEIEAEPIAEAVRGQLAAWLERRHG